MASGNTNNGMLGQINDQNGAADVFDNPEPWEPIETKLVVWSFVIAFVALGLFGYLVNKYILHAI